MERRRFTREFKLEAVRLIRDRGVSYSQASQDLKVHPTQLRTWVKAFADGQTSCCYAKSEKSWIDDPAGISWETFLTSGESTDYGDGTGEREARIAHTKACCAPQAA